ncbi:MAG: carbonic anhydrase [Actinobacteria bacterium]|nr:carbonic anhydrase [Actinomycetota bacterium]
MVFGFEDGDVHIIRSAGGIVTDDVIRSIVISQRWLATRETIHLRHTDCGMASFDYDQFVDQIEAEVGARPAFDMGAFDDVEGDLRRSMQQLSENPFILHRDEICGFVYDVLEQEARRGD